MAKPIKDSDSLAKELDNIKKRKDSPIGNKLSSTNSLLALILDVLIDIRDGKK